MRLERMDEQFKEEQAKKELEVAPCTAASSPVFN